MVPENSRIASRYFPCKKAAFAVSFDLLPLPGRPNAAWTKSTYGEQHNQARRLSTPHLVMKRQP
jgi:hypothetical protein